MKTKQSHPPKWADKMLTWFCKDEVLENVQGDLHEIYQKRVVMMGPRKAKLLFIRDVIGLLRPRLIKKFQGDHQANQFGVFKNNFKTSVRSIKHNVLFSAINVVGLAISMSVGILMIVLLSELHSFDDFHEKKNSIYRVTTSRKALFQGEAEHFASAPHYIADQLEAQVPSVEQILVLDRTLTGDLKNEDKGMPLAGYYATASFFDVLTFKLKKGNPKTALGEPGAIVLTESAARKLFGDSDPLDKTITVDANPDFRTGKITGIIEDPPINSHLDFEALVSMKTMENSLDPRRRNFKNNPGMYTQSYVYLVLTESADAEDIESTMAAMMADHNAQSAPNRLSLQPMREFVTRDAGLQPGPSFSKQKIDVMISLTIVVLLSASFNYTNLSFVRALRRSKEISVRKITGATRLHIFSQFITEAILLSTIALVIGVGLFYLIKPEFLSLRNLTAGGRSMFVLDIVPIHLFYFFLFALVIGCLAGFFPAIFLSKLKASALFNDASKIKVFLLSGVSARQSLITFQIVLSIGLIMCTVMVHKQYKYVLNYDLGYDTDNIVNINIKGDYVDLLENEYSKIAEVIETSRSSLVLGTRIMIPADAMSADRSDTVMFSCSYVDSKYLDMHGFELIAGTGFTPLTKRESQGNIIVNERFLKELNLGSPQQAIGKQIWYFDEVKLEIQGVVKDFVSKSLDAEAPEAFGFLNGAGDGNGILGVKVSGNELLATMEKLERSYKNLDPVHPFEAAFYDDQIAKTYENSKTTYTIVSFLAFLAISISTLGLLGIAVFTIETRMKEICIRKVLGAGISNLMLLLSRSFLMIITIAATIAIPVSFYIVDGLILNEFLYRTEIGLLEMLSGLIIVLFIGALMVGWQVRTAAVQNPADLLRDE
jgi:putative ABC transport system permease protein